MCSACMLFVTLLLSYEGVVGVLIVEKIEMLEFVAFLSTSAAPEGENYGHSRLNEYRQDVPKTT